MVSRRREHAAGAADVYAAITGAPPDDVRLLTIPYCIGVALGVCVFYAIPFRINEPLEVKLTEYQKDMRKQRGSRLNSVLAILIGLMSGAAMSVAVSSVWCVLHLPARIQHLLHAASPRMMGLALLSGLMLAALHNALRWTLGLPGVFGCWRMVVGGMFVGMVASALGRFWKLRRC